MRRVLLVLIVLLGGGCKDFLAPMPGEPHLIAAPPGAWRAYALAEQCLGRKGDFQQVRWYAYDSRYTPDGWEATTNIHAHKILLGRDFVGRMDVMTHEAIHEISHSRGQTADEHDPTIFGRQITVLGKTVTNPDGSVSQYSDVIWIGGMCSGVISYPRSQP